jgi:hypothetical protein
MHPWSRLVALTACLAAWSACQPGEEFGRVEQPIINGVPDTDPAHMAVVALRSNRGFCSGTLVGPRVVLTAGHCVQGADYTRFVVYFGNRTREATQVKVSHVRLHPGFNGNASLVNDVALLILAADPPAGVLPIPHLPPERGLTRADEGQRVQFVGFGRDERGEFTEKLTVFGHIQWVCDTAERCQGLGMPVWQHVICFDSADGGTCYGDSGGPAFIRRDGREYVAGITSYGVGSCYGTSCSTQVDAFSAYIQEVLDADLENGQACQDGVRCKSGHCADGVCCNMACASVCEHCTLAGQEGRCTFLEDDALEPGCGPDTGCASLPGSGDQGLGLGLGLLLVGLALARRGA